jgi:hypothetical protein
MQKSANYIQQNKAAFFDWLVFAISLSLGFIFPTLKDFALSPWFSYWMIVAFILYVIGAWLKHLPISYRLLHTGNEISNVPLLLFLLIGHWLIFFIVLIFSETAFRKITGLPFNNKKDSLGGFGLFLDIIGALFITWLVFRSKKKINKTIRYSPGFLFRRELIADILLLIAVSIFSFAFWEKGIIALLTYRPATTPGDIWYLFVSLSICYVFFYLPLRYLFLIEDHFSRQTWRRLLLIFGLLLLRTLFELIKI